MNLSLQCRFDFVNVTLWVFEIQNFARVGCHEFADVRIVSTDQVELVHVPHELAGNDDVAFDVQVRSELPYLRHLSGLGTAEHKPVLALNHTIVDETFQ